VEFILKIPNVALNHYNRTTVKFGLDCCSWQLFPWQTFD